MHLRYTGLGFSQALFAPGTNLVHAGAGNSNRPGGAGTVYVKDKLARTGTLTVDSAGVGRIAITPLAFGANGYRRRVDIGDSQGEWPDGDAALHFLNPLLAFNRLYRECFEFSAVDHPLRGL